MLVGVKNWAAAHLCANGDLGGIILFGAVLAWAVYDRISSSSGEAIRGRHQFRRAVCVTILSRLSSGTISTWRSASCFIPSSLACRRSLRRHWDTERMSVHENRRSDRAGYRGAAKAASRSSCFTSYHAHTARLVDGYCDVILVGNSLGMVMHGLETTVPVTLDMMILQGHAVMRGSKRALVIVDMPFGSYEASKEQAFASCSARAQGDRLRRHQGRGRAARMAETISFLSNAACQ